MDNYQASSYGDAVAGIYDSVFKKIDPDCVNFLTMLAEGGTALELGVGTGRIAIPLQQSGPKVYGVECSRHMILELRTKSGGKSIEVIGDDMQSFRSDLRFDLIFVVFHSLYMLETAEAQIECIENVAHHLKPTGSFVFEGFVPDMSRFSSGQCVRTSWVSGDAVSIEASTHSPVDQKVSGVEVIIRENKTHIIPISARYIWPSELDLMARIAGLKLIDRFSTWSREKFDDTSTTNISIYRKMI